MTDDEKQAREVINAFKSFESEIRSITTQLEKKRFVTQDEKQDLQGSFKKLKERIKQAAKTGTVSGLKTKQTYYEELYFGPALAKASAYFRLKTNSHPIKDNWLQELYSIELDISYPLFKLEQLFPES